MTITSRAFGRGRAHSAIVAVLAVAFAISSMPQAGKRKAKEPEVERRAFQLLRPEIVLESPGESPSAQKIGGVRIELTAVPLESTPMYFVTVQERETSAESWTGVRFGTKTPVWIGALPFYQIEPTHLQFRVRITNHLGRVLRLQGVALQFVKDGETMDMAYADNVLHKVMLLPEKSWEGVLEGPSLGAFGLKAFDSATAETGLVDSSEVRSEGVLLVGLYDVVTEMDAASTPLVRSNFEWIFGYIAHAVAEEAEAIRWKTKIDPDAAKDIVGEHPAASFAGSIPGE